MTRFSQQVLHWYDRHGRKDLPWQQDRDPYKIWVSEVMLQQTQVTTVIPYFERFIERFPTARTLADAPEDDVLHLWTGLGYYARARNLRKAARVICEQHDGAFPDSPEQAYALPGVGRSTAHAVLALAYDHTLPILDGNVKRVLARHHRIHGWPGKSDVMKQLWELAEHHTPSRRTRDYTQAIMDLGAMVCTRTPVCDLCPLAETCEAREHREIEQLPTRAPKKQKPTKTLNMLMVKNHDTVLLQRRPPSGIWGGLWSFPETATDQDPAGYLAEELGIPVRIAETWAPLRHGFTHFHLDITPVLAELDGDADRVMENTALVWYNLNKPDARGLAAPVKKLMEKLR